METWEFKRYVGIDVLRVAFAITVVIYHTGKLFDFAPSGLLQFIYYYGGYFGNYFFFMSSGLLISCRYKSNAQTEKFPNFLENRLRKIYPMYVMSNIIMLFLNRSQMTFWEIVQIIFMMSTGWFNGDTMPPNYPTWFVCILVICYVLYFAIRKISAHYPKLYLPLCSFLVVWGMILEKAGWRVLLNYRTCGEGYLNFFLGVLLGELFMRWSDDDDRLNKMGCVTLIVALAGCGIFGLKTIPGDFRWMISIICAGLICLSVHSSLNRFLSWLPSLLLRKCSMIIFLWHVPLIRFHFFATRLFGFTEIEPMQNFMLYFSTLLIFSALLSGMTIIFHKIKKRQQT